MVCLMAWYAQCNSVWSVVAIWSGAVTATTAWEQLDRWHQDVDKAIISGSSEDHSQWRKIIY